MILTKKIFRVTQNPHKKQESAGGAEHVLVAQNVVSVVVEAALVTAQGHAEAVKPRKNRLIFSVQ